MQSDALQYLNFIEIEERRQARMIRRMGGPRSEVYLLVFG